MIYLIVIGIGFLLGLAMGRWWALGIAAGIGARRLVGRTG